MKRELNELEFFTWTIGQPCNNVLSCRFYGVLSPERLQQALEQVQLKHPLLKVTIIKDEKGFPWFTSEGVGPIPLTIIEREGDEHILYVVELELRKSFELDTPPESRPPLFRVIWLRPRDFSREPSDLMFSMHHSVGDGLSQIFLFRDLFHLLNNPDQAIYPLDVTTKIANILPPEIHGKIPGNDRRFKRWLKLFKFFIGRQSAHTKTESKSPSLVFKITSDILSREVTDALITRCRLEGVTLQSALGALFSRVFPIISSPTNLRDRLAIPVGEAIGCFATGSNVRMKYKSKLSFWDNARRYQNKLNKSLRDSQVFFIYTLFDKRVVPLNLFQQFWAIFSSGKNPQRIAISNWGILEKLGIQSKMGEFRVETFLGGVSADISSIVLHLFTLNGMMTFRFIYNESTMPSNKIEKILADAFNLIKIELATHNGGARDPTD